ncbi:putative Ca2+/H+ antiporter (TMEM165/GDT1 family) [Motilibacter peucedani]|uniref:GDT1 family protein n=1 Tax=Motilibacter peucedani TaxID=598650 RepID=A0A420XLI8_9ACTN|nr:TMEM165/GDT1 family protein [Motilibacter peucedani]RKS71286.1 putative Ca2+/H+ antiporter (TMEM165/GDT1 family) [Motilibacter peucedani]
MDLAVVVTSFLPLLLLELPDKTFVATLVLSTRYRPLLTWIGVGLAFGVQCLIAVTAGGLLAKLPEKPVALAAALLFAVGALVLLRGSSHADEEEAEAEAEFRERTFTAAHGLRAVGACFLLIFLAEWGDLSQLFTAGLAARYGDPVSVFVGSWAALLVVSGLGALLGKALLTRLRLSTVRRAGGVVCIALAVLTLVEVVS